MGKKDVDVSMEDDVEEELIIVLSPIANLLAKDKLVKKILKLLKAGKLRTNHMRIALDPEHAELHLCHLVCVREREIVCGEHAKLYLSLSLWGIHLYILFILHRELEDPLAPLPPRHPAHHLFQIDLEYRQASSEASHNNPHTPVQQIAHDSISPCPSTPLSPL